MTGEIKKSIGRKILFLVLTVALAGLGISMVLSVSDMLAIRNTTVSGSEKLGNTAAEKSEDALIAQMKKNLQDLVVHKSSDHADVILDNFLDSAKYCADYATWLCQNPEKVRSQVIRMPSHLILESGTVVIDAAQAAGTFANLCPVFESILDENRDIIASIYLVSEQGFMITCEGENNIIDELFFDYKSSAWYQKIKQQQEPLFMEAYQDTFGRGLMTTCIAPYYGPEGIFAGAVCIDLLLEDFYQEILDIDISENSIAAILDADGNLIAGPKVDFDAEKFKTVWGLETADRHKELIQEVLSGSTGVVEANDMYFAYASIQSMDWLLIIRVPRSDIIAPVTQMRQDIQAETQNVKSEIEQNISIALISLLLVMAGMILVVIYVSVRFTGKLVEPIKILQKQVKVVGGGNLDTEVEISSEDEIGELAQEFQNMTISLKAQMEQIRQVTAEKERIDAELNIAAQIQTSMLPCAFPKNKGFDIYALMDPAKEVGGDFYDFFWIDDSHFAVVMADVSGKGVPSALFMVIAKTLIKDLAQMGLSLDEVFRQANEKLCESNDEGMFVTAWMGILDIHSGHMVYVNAGHNPPLICRAGESFAYLKQKPGFILAGMEGMRYQCGEIDFGDQDMLYLYTDGVTEATDRHEELYGEMRLQAVLNQQPRQSVKAILESVKADISGFVGDAPQSDDITMLGLKILRDQERRES